MAYRVGTRKQLVAVCVAAGLGFTVLDGPSRAEATGFAVPTLSARDGIVLAQTTAEPGKKAESQKPKKTKRRAIRCGGPGLPDCPM
jgi:hypothetical protein